MQIYHADSTGATGCRANMLLLHGVCQPVCIAHSSSRQATAASVSIPMLHSLCAGSGQQQVQDIEAAHERAVQAGSSCYQDPATGYSVFTEAFLRDKQASLPAAAHALQPDMQRVQHWRRDSSSCP